MLSSKIKTNERKTRHLIKETLNNGSRVSIV